MKCCPQFDQLINSLSAKSVKELFLRIDSYALLPSSLFSVPDLNSLKLQGFIFEEPIWSVGFSKLTLLELKHVKLHNGFLQNFLPKCPLLEELRVLQCEITEERPVFVTSSVKVLLFHSYPGEIRFEYTSLLSVLSVLPPCDGKYCVYSDLSGPLKLDIVALFDSLPALEQLNLGVEFLLLLSEGHVPHQLPALLQNLKVLEIPSLVLSSWKEARVVACLITSSPNLLKLTIGLHGFFFEEPTWSVGFSKLTLLELKDVLLPTSFFNDFLPKCPILEELRVFDCSVDQDPVFVTSSVKVLLFHSYRWTIRFVYTPHLSVLSVVEPSREYFYYDSDYLYYDFHPTCKSDIVSQFGSLPALEQLNLGVQFLTELLEESEDQVGVCCLERLEEFTIGNSRGTQVELDLVRFVLATAPVLKRVFINPKKGLSSEIVTKFLVEVTQYERISRYAKVNYALVKLDEA
ncbi:F-box/FBD/LRR-repeat protein At1g13570 [Linum perenne]